ncbi:MULTISPECIES: PEP-CTERM sorting domain-containing protein [unclassified Lentimonas]|uniref:PEP-CTERM sorting domain-containing protein n=1 Tax=unclassified Lentimonas TaxID=2630993 RepID=UPI00132CB7B5|nr:MULTISPECIES: PEP-CTERM sorting domain-containing protein [unclassified Lentimonas]CAA6692442.1 Unannotated [Lentimonas sp. CC19]CAA6693497.1 Unannotated [Lentimonas sp. CC10]CAA7070808.1 Unannotated [Lentimonas sp. CC11]
MKKTVTLLSLLATATVAQAAAELVFSDTTVTQNSDNTTGTYNVSVFDGKAGWSSNQYLGTGFAFGDGTVEDYALVGNGTTPYAEGSAGLITFDGSSTTGANSFKDWAAVWTSNDPGTDFVGGDAANFTTETVSQGFGFTGSIDISGFKSGTIYLFHGTFSATYTDTLNLSMTGAGQTLLNATTSISGNNHSGFITTFTFTDAEDYDQITYQYLNNDTVTSPGSAARFGGLIFDGVAIPEPSSYALLGGLLALSAVAMKRRRA